MRVRVWTDEGRDEGGQENEKRSVRACRCLAAGRATTAGDGQLSCKAPHKIPNLSLQSNSVCSHPPPTCATALAALSSTGTRERSRSRRNALVRSARHTTSTPWLPGGFVDLLR